MIIIVNILLYIVQIANTYLLLHEVNTTEFKKVTIIIILYYLMKMSWILFHVFCASFSFCPLYVFSCAFYLTVFSYNGVWFGSHFGLQHNLYLFLSDFASASISFLSLAASFAFFLCFSSSSRRFAAAISPHNNHIEIF